MRKKAEGKAEPRKRERQKQTLLVTLQTEKSVVVTSHGKNGVLRCMFCEYQAMDVAGNV